VLFLDPIILLLSLVLPLLLLPFLGVLVSVFEPYLLAGTLGVSLGLFSLFFPLLAALFTILWIYLAIEKLILRLSFSKLFIK
jgi:hypothetical protein